jgi:hypothetical protein
LLPAIVFESFTAYRLEIVSNGVLADLPPQTCSPQAREAEVDTYRNAAEDDVIDNRGQVWEGAADPRTASRGRWNIICFEQELQYTDYRSGRRGVPRNVIGMIRSGPQRLPGRVADRRGVPVCVSGLNGGDRPP